jgi:glycosyltransferase involved in cell wall biosynthesis
MKVLLVSHSSGLAGAERDLLELARALMGRPDAQTTVVLPRDGPLRALLDDAGVHTITLRHRWWVTVRAPLPRRAWALAVNAVAVVRLRRLITRLQPDVVVTGTLTIPSAAVAARLTNRPHLWYVQEFGAEDHGFRFHLGRDRTMRLIGELSAVVAACSGAVAAHLARWVSAEKIHVLHYAFDVPSRREEQPVPADPGSFTLVLVGTKLEGKGQEEALAALELLRSRGVPARLRLVGPGRPEYVLRLKRTARRLDVEAHTDFVDEVSDAGPELEAADAVLVCSRSEAFGRVAVEAMRKRVPVVGARSGGTQEQLTSSGGGLLYEPGDAADLATELERLYRDPDLRRMCGERGARWAEQFSLERFGTEFLELANEAIERHRVPAGGSHL